MAAVLKSLRRLKSYFFSSFDSKDPDLEWKQQAEAVERNPMYKLIHLGGRGFLIDEYLKRESDAQFLRLLDLTVRPFLYPNGEGMVREIDYARYRRRVAMGSEHYELHGITDEQLLEEFEMFQSKSINKFTPHAACWDVQKRGEAGETILHLCYLNSTGVHKAIARHLLQLFPQMVRDMYEGSAYYGETALHLAIVQNDLETVKMLVNDFHAKLDQRATGRFFRPKGLTDRKVIQFENLDYEAEAYYGEYPLAFAASLGHAEIYDFLIEASLRAKRGQGKCNPDQPDSYGNTIMHMIVIHNQKLMFNHVVFHSKMPASFSLKNAAGLTPLQLSYKLGKGELFSSLLDLTSETQWIFGNVAYVAYPLDQLDSIAPNGALNEGAALSSIVEHDGIEHLKMLEGQVISELLQQKWKTFARNRIIFKFFWALFHLSQITAVVYLRPEGNLWNTEGVGNKFRLFLELCILIGCVAKITSEVLEIISRGSLLNYLMSLLHFPTKGLFMVAVFLQLSCLFWRLMGLQVVEDYATMLSIPMAWHYLFYFFRGHPVLGPLIVSIQKICTGDLVRFSIIYLIFVTMFSEVFYYMFITVPATETDAFYTANGAFMTVFRMSFGDMHFEDMSHSRYNVMTFIIYGLFMILIPLLLFNMMIAMMTRTFQNIKERSLMEWKRQWVMIILNVERSIPRKMLVNFQKQYSSTLKFHKCQKARRIHQKPLAILNAAKKIERKDGDEMSVASGTDNWDMPLVKLASEQKRTTVTLEPDSGSSEQIEVQALLVHKVLHKSQAAIRRDVQLQWRTLRRKLLDIARERLAKEARLHQS
ncbi:Transient receptor potential cation channel subfamily V member 6 [Holothuria leucospilota]|uniref:Transient receptor potential cation channel subfamily V member 6 n=1 Tax=Holothuria leucospilota TaxID=206669 RepID=A0A9Q1HJQ2_HOLLE|nr:Transient receptor potential cation channel subfamily V member 6 [Holothuria leucospilota]